MELLSLAVGFVLLAAGGESLVRSAVALARRLGLPPLLIGISVVAFATSAPELFVSIRSAASGSPGIALGNVVGSNIANLALGLGLMGLFAPFRAPVGALRRDAYALAVVTAAFLALGAAGSIGRAAGASMVAVLVWHVWRSYDIERRSRTGAAEIHEEQPEELGASWPAGVAAAVLVASVIGLLVGSDLLVGGAVAIAAAAGVSDAIIGVSVVALGTSLPELATTVAAARRQEHDVALGNLLGSSMFNLLAIVGLTAVVAPIPVEREFLLASGGVMAMLTLAVAPVFTGRWRMGRLAGMSLMAGYALYVLLTTGLLRLW